MVNIDTHNNQPEGIDENRDFLVDLVASIFNPSVIDKMAEQISSYKLIDDMIEMVGEDDLGIEEILEKDFKINSPSAFMFYDIYDQVLCEMGKNTLEESDMHHRILQLIKEL